MIDKAGRQLKYNFNFCVALILANEVFRKEAEHFTFGREVLVYFWLEYDLRKAPFSSVSEIFITTLRFSLCRKKLPDMSSIFHASTESTTLLLENDTARGLPSLMSTVGLLR